MATAEQAQPRRELRLALVLYGGVSLCIYMHGTTKEVNRLISASRRLALGEHADRSASEAVYAEVLGALAAREEVRTDVVVDVIGGASAGAINGVYLAKALARNLSQDRLRDLWMEKGDINGLLRGPPLLPLRARALLLLPRLITSAPLRGDAMSRWLYEALTPMNAARSTWAETLMPEETTLDLLVTTTDCYGYDRQIPIADPPIVHDEQHRHVLRFSQADQLDRFDGRDDVSLAFAARATSSFPGAFDAVSTSGFARDIGQAAGVDASLFRIYELSGADYKQTYFVDGGVLDNRPFAPAIEAIRAKPAAVDVRRRVIYLEPDPRPPAGRPAGVRPGALETILASLSRLPRQQPILDSLMELRGMNTRVREIRDAIEGEFPDVSERVRARYGELVRPGAAQPSSEADQSMHDEVGESGGGSYKAYVRLRVLTLLETLAGAICALLDYPLDSNHGLLVSATMRAWAQSRGLDPGVSAADRSTVSAQLDFLRRLDIDFARRRVRFTLAGVNWLYDDIPTAPAVDGADQAALARRERLRIDATKQRMWQEIQRLSQLLGDALAERRDEAATCFPEADMRSFLQRSGLDAARWLERVGEVLDRLIGELAEVLATSVQESGERFAGDLDPLLAEYTDSRRRDLLVRYLGFPAWDRRLFPLEAAAGAGERDAIDVVRSSPLDATLLWPSGTPKLKGVKMMHFGAFFSLDARENDYLIGRLDGAERLIKLLVTDKAEQRQWCAKAFLAILEEERDLQTTAALAQQVQAKAEALW
jgi:patatin-related protein